MSSDHGHAAGLWAASAAAQHIAPFDARAYRVVESQETVATMTLVDNRDEQALLEELLDASKPPLAPDLRGLHYLLAAPFRYPPLKYGSRFGARHERSLFYGSANLGTAFAECAYYRLVFLSGPRQAFSDDLITFHTAFSVVVRSERGLDLCQPAFSAITPILRSASDYQRAQQFGSAMRAAGVDAFSYYSARATGDEAINIGVFSPAALNNQIDNSAAWVCISNRQQIRWVDPLHRSAMAFAREQFEIDGQLPQPAL